MKVAILWLINEKGEILIAKRAAHMDSDAGVWGPSVSGKVENSETPIEAIVREAEEELNLSRDAISPKLLHEEIYDHQDGQGREFSIFYARITSNITDSFILEPNEVAEIKWVRVNNLKELINKEPETIIISSATNLWNSIFQNLKPITA